MLYIFRKTWLEATGLTRRKTRFIVTEQCEESPSNYAVAAAEPPFLKATLVCIPIPPPWSGETVIDTEVSVDGRIVIRLDRTSSGGGVSIYVKSYCT